MGVQHANRAQKANFSGSKKKLLVRSAPKGILRLVMALCSASHVVLVRLQNRTEVQDVLRALKASFKNSKANPNVRRAVREGTVPSVVLRNARFADLVGMQT